MKSLNECPKCQSLDISMILSGIMSRAFKCNECDYTGEGESNEIPKTGMWKRSVKRWNSTPRPIMILEES